MSVLRDMEKLFLHTEHRVVSAFPVIKCSSSSQSRNQTTKPPQPTDKPRVLCVTVQRRVGSRGFKATLHICKGEPGHYDIRKSFRLRLVTKLEAFKPPTSTQPLLEITVMQRAFTGGDTKLSFEASSDATRGEIIGLLYSFCKSHEKKSPLLVGLKRAELGMYADVLEDDEELDEHGEDSSMNLLGEDSSSQMMITPRNTMESGALAGRTPMSTTDTASPPDPSMIGVGDKNKMSKQMTAAGSILAGQQRTSMSLSAAEAEMDAAWSARQDTQLASLLDAVAGGGISLNDVRSRLTAELAALEGANVHELLESAAAAGGIDHEIGNTLEYVDDLEETLGMLDAKLRHMREDMAAIEEWNNRLETHSRSNVRLLATLESVESALMLEPSTEAALKSPDWDRQTHNSTMSTSGGGKQENGSLQSNNALEQAISAAWDLHRHLLIVSAETPAAAASAASAAAFGNNINNGSSSLGFNYSPSSMTNSATPMTGLSLSTSKSAAASRLPLFISPNLQSMTAVATRKRYMQVLAKDFLHRATDLLEREYSHIADGLVKVVAALPAGDRLRILSHTQLHTRAAQLKPLLEVVVAMRPGAAAPLQGYYCKSVNALLRKEISGATKDLIKQATSGTTASGSGSGLGNIKSTYGSGGREEPVFIMKSADSIRTLERICSTPAKIGTSEASGNSARGGHHHHHHHRRGSSISHGANDGVDPSSSNTVLPGKEASVVIGKPLEDCFDSLISTFFPLLTTEVEKCLGLVCLCEEERDPIARIAISILLSGIPEAILLFFDTLRPPKILPCLAMIATTLHWQSKLSSRAHESGGSLAVCDILKQCERKLRSIWDTYVADSVSSIQNFDGKSGLSGYSSVHVLPFIINLEAVASRIEGIVADWIQRDASGDTGRSRSPSPTKKQENVATTTQRSNDEKTPPALKPSPFEAPESDSTGAVPTPLAPNVLARSASSMAVATPSAAVRTLADALYSQVLDAMLASVESHAVHDAKHAPRIRLENYSFLRLSLQGLPLAQAPVLQRKCSEAATLRNSALAACVEQQLEILKLDKLVHVAGQLAELGASGISPAEAGNRLQWTSADARHAVSTAASGLDKRFLTARQKLHKHLGSSSPYLIDVVWERTGVRCGQAWEDLEQRLPAVFPGVGVVPTSEGLRTAFNAAKVASP